MDWIMSEGGPLICIEKALADLWGGVDRLTVADPSATCDYDRACASNDYIRKVSLQRLSAITLGAPPVDSYFRYLPSGYLSIAQILCADANFDLNETLAQLDESIFEQPRYLTEWQISSSPLVLFDSAIPGEESEGERLTCKIRPGQYHIRSQTYGLDDGTSCLLHRFEVIN